MIADNILRHFVSVPNLPVFLALQAAFVNGSFTDNWWEKRLNVWASFLFTHTNPAVILIQYSFLTVTVDKNFLHTSTM